MGIDVGIDEFLLGNEVIKGVVMISIEVRELLVGNMSIVSSGAIEKVLFIGMTGETC